MSTETTEQVLLPHHEQKPLCTTRLPYRQGRKLTAVKVYTVNTESNHLLVFGVPALNLRQEIKAQFLKFGSLNQFHVTKDHPGEAFTETYHAKYDRIQSARIAKRMLDTKGFYGGSLHICYAPELETIQETRAKLLQRKKDVLNRLKNLNKEKHIVIEDSTEHKDIEETDLTLNYQAITKNTKEQSMIPENTNHGALIHNEVPKHTNDRALIHNEVPKHTNDRALIHNEVPKHTNDRTLIHNEVPKPNHRALIHNEVPEKAKKLNMGTENIIYMKRKAYQVKGTCKKIKQSCIPDSNVDIVDFTSTDKHTLSNINEALNYNKFGNEDIRVIEAKPINIIKFNKS